MSEVEVIKSQLGTSDIIHVIIVGLGQAGSRFVRACLAIKEEAPNLRIVAGVDVDTNKCIAVEQALGIRCYSSIEDAARIVSPALAIVTVSEHQHFQILLDLKRYFPTLRRIMCEKPLAATASEARLLSQTFENHDLSLNFVERFSPVVTSLQLFMERNSRVVLRANCIWGKYRVKDVRPTLGVVSVELAHPLDLALMLAKVRPGTEHKTASIVATRSNFDTGHLSSLPLDTIHVALEFAHGLHVLISSSLLWSKRERKIEFLLADQNGIATELAVLVFDNPRWDIDRLEIYDIRAKGGQPKTLYTEDIAAEAWPSNQLTIGKVCRFLNANLAELSGQTSELLPRLDQGVYVQELMESITQAANAQALTLNCFAEPVTVEKPEFEKCLDCLSRLANGSAQDTEALNWDLPY